MASIHNLRSSSDGAWMVITPGLHTRSQQLTGSGRQEVAVRTGQTRSGLPVLGLHVEAESLLDGVGLPPSAGPEDKALLLTLQGAAPVSTRLLAPSR